MKANDALLSIIDRYLIGDAGNTAEYRGLQITSAFQPIFSVAHRRSVGVEGLLRATTTGGEAVPPSAIFTLVQSDEELVAIDRLSRALHVNNFGQLGLDDAWLFLNVSPNVVINGPKYGSFFGMLLEHYGVPPRQVVIEILEQRIDDASLLRQAVSYYRDLGCLIAIDDFGAGHSNFERLWRLEPDIVKLDRDLIVEAEVNERARRILPRLVSLIHEVGALVLMEGVETEQQALTALASDVDLLQGFYFARPVSKEQLAGQTEGTSELYDILHNRLEQETQHDNYDVDSSLLTAFRKAASGINEGMAFKETAPDLFKVSPKAIRCYLLDNHGNQTEDNITAPDFQTDSDKRYLPLASPIGANWYRRPYFRAAVREPGRVRVSRPYLSLTDHKMCITLSIALRAIDGELKVLCVDILKEEAIHSDASPQAPDAKLIPFSTTAKGYPRN